MARGQGTVREIGGHLQREDAGAVDAARAVNRRRRVGTIRVSRKGHKHSGRGGCQQSATRRRVGSHGDRGARRDAARHRAGEGGGGGEERQHFAKKGNKKRRSGESDLRFMSISRGGKLPGIEGSTSSPSVFPHSIAVPDGAVCGSGQMCRE